MPIWTILAKNSPWSHKTDLTPLLCIEIPVPTQKVSRLACLCSLSKIVLLYFGTVPTVWFFFHFIMLNVYYWKLQYDHTLSPCKDIIIHGSDIFPFRILGTSVVDRGFEHRSHQTNNYKIGICWFSTYIYWSKNKDWLTRNQDNVSEQSYMPKRRPLFRWYNTEIIQLGMPV